MRSRGYTLDYVYLNQRALVDADCPVLCHREMEGWPAGVLVGICSDVDFAGVYLRGTPFQGKMASTRTVGPGNAGIVFRGLATGAASLAKP